MNYIKLIESKPVTSLKVIGAVPFKKNGFRKLFHNKRVIYIFYRPVEKQV